MTKFPALLAVGWLCSVPLANAQPTDQSISIEQQANENPQSALVIVAVDSGRTFRGIVDPRTDSQRLWIRCVYGQAVILRPVDWDRIVTVQSAGQSHTGEAFRELADRLKLATPRQPWPTEKRTLFPVARVPACVPVVRSLHAAAHLANWDADAEADGLSLVVAPLTDCGDLLPLEGTVEATLYGYDRRSGLPFEHWSQLARWSQPVNLACYGTDGGVVRLPFDSALADWDQIGSPRRLLRIRLQAPGHGTFEAEIYLSAGF